MQKEVCLIQAGAFSHAKRISEGEDAMPSLGGGTGEPHERTQMEEARGNVWQSLPLTPKSLLLPRMASYLKHNEKHGFIQCYANCSLKCKAGSNVN